MNNYKKFSRRNGKIKDNIPTNKCDEIFAKLTEMFGDDGLCNGDVILAVCKKCDWELETCIENLIQISDDCQKDETNIEDDFQQLKISYKTSDVPQPDLPDDDDDVDIVIESENIETNIVTDLGAIRKILKKNITDTSQNQNSKVSDNSNSRVKESFSSFLKNQNNSFEFPPSDTQKNNKNLNRNQNNVNYDKIVHLINQGIKIMIIMRGLPGSGKSYTAKKIIDQTVGGNYKNHIFSTDDYFYDCNNRYNFKPDQISAAHDSNQAKVEKAAKDGWSPIFVDNTNIKVWEMHIYFQIAIKYKYFIEILEPIPPWGISPGILQNKNTHLVPKDVIERMKNNYENISVINLLKSLNAESHAKLSPQLRTYPKLNEIPENLTKNSNLIKTNENRESLLQQLNNSTNNSENLEENFHLINESIGLEWKKHEHEMKEFWGSGGSGGNTKNVTDNLQQSKIIPSVVQPKINTNRIQEKSPIFFHNNRFSVLENDDRIITPPPPQNEINVNSNETTLEKHKIGCTNENLLFAQIREIYPQITISYLWDLFEKCNGDGNWAMDILLKEESKLGQFIDQNNDHQLNFECDCLKKSEDLMWFQDITTEPLTIDSVLPIDPPTPPPPPTTTPLKTRRDKSFLTDEHLTTKKKIEDIIMFGDEHYSEHNRKIRDIKRGVPNLHELRPQWSGGSLNELGAYAVLPGDQDVQSTDGETSSETDNDEIIEITLGQEFVANLDQMFGVETFTKTAMEDFKTNVFISKQMAKQLYALWMESVYNQIEEQKLQSIKEDEEFAKTLNSQEKYAELQHQPTNFKEIMDMQKAWSAYKAEIDEWKNEPKTIASHLRNEKLYEIFPDIDKDILQEILVAHDYNFDETVETLKNSLQYNVEEKIENKSKELFEQARLESEITAATSFQLAKSSSNSSARSLEIKKLGPDEAKLSALREFEECRNMAIHHSQLKTDCYSSANRAVQQKNGALACYYSQIANLHKQKIDMYNHKAANCIMEVHNLRQNNPDIIDLHYLHSSEAIECLDIFLDKHINKIKTNPKNNKMLHVITGRGLHSVNGIPTIKNKVRHRLRERGLRAIEVNPGLLKVKIFMNSKLTQQMT